MLADDLGDQRQAEPRAVRLGGDERVEQDRQDILRNARAIVAHAKFERQRDAVLAAGDGDANAGPERRRQRDLAARIRADRLGGVLHQVEEDLHQLVAVGEDRRQRRVVVLEDLDAAGETVPGDRLHMVEHDMDVDRVALDRPLVGKDLHAVDQRDDAVGLVGDEPGQRAILVAQPAFQQLRGAADARQRVLDLVREHRRQAGHRAGGAAMRHLAVDLVGHRAFLEHHDDRAGQLGDRSDIEIDDLLLADARRGNVDAIFVDRRLALAHLVDQRQQRAAERHEARQAALRQDRRARPEEVFGIGIGVVDQPVGADHDHRPADRVEHDLRGIECRGRRLLRILGLGRLGIQIHATSLSSGAVEPSAKAERSAAITMAGSVAVSTALRVAGPANGAWRSRYQPRCLRACLRPLSMP